VQWRGDSKHEEIHIEIILELVLTTTGELLLQLVVEILFEFGFDSMGESLRRRRRAHPALALGGAALMGALVGLVTSLVWPTRLFQPGPLPGASLLISPLVTGLVMDRYGRWRKGKGSYLATFWGGALFAFGMALVRFVWVGI
jgi:hypothetical protein